MYKRQFLTGSAALLAWYMAGSAQATSAAVDHKTKLVVADQSELIRHLLDASGERKTLPFQLELPNFAGGPAIFEAMRAGALDIAYVGDTPPSRPGLQAYTCPSLPPLAVNWRNTACSSRPMQV